jgi:hypothetical protein
MRPVACKDVIRVILERPSPSASASGARARSRVRWTLVVAQTKALPVRTVLDGCGSGWRVEPVDGILLAASGTLCPPSNSR